MTTSAEPKAQVQADGPWQMAEGKGDWVARNLALADLLGEHDFDLREWRVLDFLRRQTYGAGRAAAYVERLDLFCEAVDISRGNVSRILKRLKASLVIEERPEFCYGFMFPEGNWKVPRRLRRLELPEQLALFEPPAHLRDVLRETFAAGMPGEAPGFTYAGRSDGRPALQTGVPDSGTPEHFGGAFPIRERGREGNGDGGKRSVPDSGTGHAYMQPCSTALSLEHIPMATCPSVSDSGTGRLDSFRQEVLDRVRKLGAFTDAPDDNNRSTWLGMVRKRVHVVARLVGDCEHARRLRRISNPGGWMMDQWKRWGRPDQ